jgi:thiol-disulfide isomerase/thioredoxin
LTTTDAVRDGVMIFAKRECETCQMVEPVLTRLASSMETIVLTQDDPTFPANLAAFDDTSLEKSFKHDIEAVPTLLRFKDGKEVARTQGWDRAQWRKITGISDLGVDLPEMRPGCGSKSREPGVYETLMAQFGKLDFKSRPIQLGGWDDEIEACFDRGWSDGLPVVPPTDVRIIRMLDGTT